MTADVSQNASWLSPDRPVPDIRTALPGPKAQPVLERDAAVTSPSLPRAYLLVPNRASGSVVEDADGNLFLDFNAGIAVNSTGHCHPRVVEAVRSQAEQLLHYSASDFYLPIYSQMCEASAAVLPIFGHKRVFLTNSGAEAVEGAMKLTRYATGRPYIISFFGAFHGRTYGAVSLTYGILLVADEVQSGMGRTGQMWAIELADVEPDILISAKGMASGLPLGAFAAKTKLMERWGAGAHGSTYGGSPVPCPAGLATLETIAAEKLTDNATKVGEELFSGLGELPARFPRTVTECAGSG